MSRPVPSRPVLRMSWGIVSALALSAGVAQATSVTRSPDVLYLQQTRVHADGRVERLAEGSPYVRLKNGRRDTVDVQRLEDADGNRYSLRAAAWQAEEGEPVVYEVRLERERGTTPMSSVEREQLFEESHPDASDADLQAFRERDLRYPQGETSESPLSMGVEAWLHGADPQARLSVTITMTEQPPLSLPKLSPALAEDDPVFYLERAVDRVIAIEERKTEIEGLHRSLRGALEAKGGRVQISHWVTNSFEAEVGPEALGWLAARTEVRSVELREESVALGNTGVEIREAAQVQQFLDHGYDGETGSGRNPAISDIYVGIVDAYIDHDHPAWSDWYGGPNRLRSWYGWNGEDLVEGSDLALAYDVSMVWDYKEWEHSQHGSIVAGQVLGDLTDGQEPNQSDTWEAQRTGMSTEASFVFVQKIPWQGFQLGQPGTASVVETMLEENVDIVNASYSVGEGCLQLPLNDAVDAAMLDGIFWVTSAGNGGQHKNNQYDPVCTVGPPATAAGSFTVGGLDHHSSDLRTAPIYSHSSRGGDVHGRNMVALVAAAGRERSGLIGEGTLPFYDDDYGGHFWHGTSFSAPLVVGAAANHKHLLIERYGAALANLPGVLYSNMLLMGDRQSMSGRAALATDPVWGAGRMRMRMFEDAGMDAPWRFETRLFWVPDGSTLTGGLNDVHGVNTVVPADVEQMNMAMWWFEPNVGEPEIPADLGLQVRRVGGGSRWTASSASPQQRRIYMNQVGVQDWVGGDTWEWRVSGTDVPPSTDPAYHEGLSWRLAVLSWYWEDTDRDDANGPEEVIQ